MTFNIILMIFILSISISVDAFLVSIVDAIVYNKIHRKKLIIIPIIFAFFHALMPLLGYFLASLIYGHIVNILHKVSFALILIVASKMLFDGLKPIDLDENQQIKKKHKRKIKIIDILFQAIATSIDAFAVGISLLKISNNFTIGFHISIILIVTFSIFVFGIFLGKKLYKIFKGKDNVANIVASFGLFLIAILMVLG